MTYLFGYYKTAGSCSADYKLLLRSVHFWWGTFRIYPCCTTSTFWYWADYE